MKVEGSVARGVYGDIEKGKSNTMKLIEEIGRWCDKDIAEFP